MSGGIPSWARPGEKVVCIFDGWEDIPGLPPSPARLPMINEILTIREVSNSDEWAAATPSINYIGPTMTLFTFDELGHDWMFPASRFRPLITNSQEDDLAIFRPILDQVPTGEDA